MNTTPSHRLTNRLVAILLVLVMTCVYIIGDSYAPIIAEKNKQESTDLLSYPLSYDIGLPLDNELKDVSQLVLAENSTVMGKTSALLSEAFTKMPKTVKSSSELDNCVSSFYEQIADLKAQSLKELSITDNNTDEFEDYKNNVISGYTQLEELLNDVNIDNYEEVMANVSALINSEKPYVSLADDLPFNDVSEDNITYSAYNPESVTDYQIDDSSYSNNDLQQTNDTIINDDVRAEFADLESVLEVYQYIKNNYMMEFYFGSRKGAVGAFVEKAGNDYDIASLLIGVLRDRNIPARYAKGEIELTAKQAMEWTATDDINVAIRSIAALGISTTGMISNGETVAVRLEHTWVEAYVPYTDYRGTGNRSGERLWIPLDASFKKTVYNEGVKVNDIQEYLNKPENKITSSSELYGVNIGGLANEVSDDNSALFKYMLENGYGECTQSEAFGGASIVTEDLGYLPLSLPYSNASQVESFGDIPESETDSVNFSLYGNSARGTDFSSSDAMTYKYLAPDVYGKRIVLSYVPATQADQDTINKYGSIFSAPAYLIKMKPQLSIDGKIVAEGNICNAGYVQQYAITLHNGAKSNNDSVVSNNIEIGGMYCIGMDYGNISACDLKSASDHIDSYKDSTSSTNVYSEEIMGGMLYSISRLYFGQLDMYNKVLAGQTNVTNTRALSLGIIGFKVNVISTFNRPSELNEGGFFLDIGHDVHSVVSNKNNDTDEKAFMLQSGIYASAMEHGVLEQVTGIESVSTIKTLQYAQKHNIPTHIINKENLTEELDTITVSSNVKQEIRKAINSGKVVIIPETEITINQWSGVGYMVLDTDTFACGYMISGGTAGGAMSAWEVIDRYIELVADGILAMIAYELAKAAILAALPFGWVAAAFTIAEITMLAFYVGNIVNLFIQFKNTGRVEYLQEALIEIAAGLTLVAIMPAIKPKLEQMKADVTNLVNSLKSQPKYPTTPGGCFIAGTLISTPKGPVPIEDVKLGDVVWSFDPENLEVTEKYVDQVLIHKSNDLVKITIGNEIITATSNHPFYAVAKGFISALELRAGDILITVNGERVVVEKIQHEILEVPVDVYNFSIRRNHTYFVGNVAVGVHNAGGPCMADPLPDGEPGGTGKTSGIDEFIKGNKTFEEVKGDYAKAYAEAVKSNKKWSWVDDIPGSEKLSGGQKTKIKKLAIEQGLLPDIKVTKVNGQKYGFADFEGAGVVEKTVTLPEDMWLKSDAVQFGYCNNQIGGAMEGYTWHHSETPGIMQLIPTGIHNMITHNGGRSPGMWGYVPGLR